MKGTNYRSLADRFDKDPTFAARQAERGTYSPQTCGGWRFTPKAICPHLAAPASRSCWAAGSQVSFSAAKTEVVAKIVIFEGVPVAELQALGLADQHTEVNMAMGWHGTFMDVETFAGLALGNEDARKVVTFNGLVTLSCLNPWRNEGGGLRAPHVQLRACSEQDPCGSASPREAKRKFQRPRLKPAHHHRQRASRIPPKIGIAGTMVATMVAPGTRPPNGAGTGGN